MAIFRISVTNDWVHVSPGLVSKGGWGTVDIAWASLGGFLLGCSNTKKRGDHGNKKIFINKSFKALITLRKGHHSLLNVPLRRCFIVGGKMGLQKGNFCLKQENKMHSVHWGINPPRKHHPTLLWQAPPLNLQTVKVVGTFQEISPYILFFCDTLP